MSRTPIASIEHAFAAYGTTEVLHDISWDIMPGDFWGLIGPNGAGKSTLLGLFNGMTPIKSGSVRFSGVLLNRRSERQIRPHIAHVFQLLEIDPKVPISVHEMVLAGTYSKLGLFCRPGKHEYALADEALERVGISHLAKRPLGSLSGGERQRAAIARALTQEPQLMLLDEPTASLDWQAQRDILKLIASLRLSLGLTIVMATHDLNAVSQMTTHTAMLKEGRLLGCVPTAKAMDRTLLEQVYDTHVTVIEHEGRKVALF